MRADIHSNKMGMIKTLASIYRHEGYKTLFAGLGATAIRAFPTNAATFYVVVAVKSLLQSDLPPPPPLS